MRRLRTLTMLSLCRPTVVSPFNPLQRRCPFSRKRGLSAHNDVAHLLLSALQRSRIQLRYRHDESGSPPALVSEILSDLQNSMDTETPSGTSMPYEAATTEMVLDAVTASSNRLQNRQIDEAGSAMVDDRVNSIPKKVEIGTVPPKNIVHTTGEKETANDTDASREAKVITNPKENKRDWYGSHPCVTTTALAHNLWKHQLEGRSNITVVDATAGNGHDARAVADLIFPNPSNQLVCLDIQAEACAATTQRLQSALPPELYETQVRVIQQSHENIADCCAVVKETAPVTLAIYNLGFLPNCTTKSVLTRTGSTLVSLAQVASILERGGMVSVVTYPRTNLDEHDAVRKWMTGLALFSSRTEDWKDCEDDQVLEQLSHVHSLVPSSGWRVHENTKLGWKRAPVLMTAVRIK